jgi:hypothetical protein
MSSKKFLQRKKLERRVDDSFHLKLKTHNSKIDKDRVTG